LTRLQSVDRQRSLLKADKRSFSWSETNEIELTVTGRNSGKPLPRPVWFAVKGTELFLLPVTGTDSEWYKNILRDPRVTVTSGRQILKGKLRTITQKNQVDEVIALFEKKYGASDIKKYYPKPNVAASISLD
jgi:deazaflavin-dependent oxidoreductase (nitroreductase family)